MDSPRASMLHANDEKWSPTGDVRRVLHGKARLARSDRIERFRLACNFHALCAVPRRITCPLRTRTMR